MSFNIQDVLSRVNEFLKKNEIEECRDVFLQEIIDFSDYYTENCESEPESEEAQQMRASLLQLWFQYASFEASLKQFKKAVDVFEKAMGDPIVGRRAHIYRLCAEYYQGRNKPGNAQKVFLNALCADPALAREETDQLWCLLLHLVQGISGSSIGLAQLKQEAQQTMPAQPLPEVPTETETQRICAELKAQPSLSAALIAAAAAPAKTTATTTTMTAVAAKRSLDVAESKESESFAGRPQTTAAFPSQTHTQAHTYTQAQTPMLASAVAAPVSMSASSKHTASSPVNMLVPVGESDTGDALDNLCGLSPEELVRLFHHRPPMLFIAPTSEPMLSGPKNLLQDEIEYLERFLGVSFASLCVPARADDLARQRADFLLDVLEGLWLSQALKERHFDAWFGKLKKQQLDERRIFEEKLKTQAMPDGAVQLEKKRLLNRWSVQQELLKALVNKVNYTMLLEQERILCELQFPRFLPGFLRQIENINNILPAPNPKNNFFDDLIRREIASQRRVLSVLLHFRLVRKTPVVAVANPVVGGQTPTANMMPMGVGSMGTLDNKLQLQQQAVEQGNDANVMKSPISNEDKPATVAAIVATASPTPAAAAAPAVLDPRQRRMLQRQQQVTVPSSTTNNVAEQSQQGTENFVDKQTPTPLQIPEMSAANSSIPSAPDLSPQTSPPAGSDHAARKKRRRIAVVSQSSEPTDEFELEQVKLERSGSYGHDNSFDVVQKGDEGDSWMTEDPRFENVNTLFGETEHQQ